MEKQEFLLREMLKHVVVGRQRGDATLYKKEFPETGTYTKTCVFKDLSCDVEYVLFKFLGSLTRDLRNFYTKHRRAFEEMHTNTEICSLAGVRVVRKLISRGRVPPLGRYFEKTEEQELGKFSVAFIRCSFYDIVEFKEDPKEGDSIYFAMFRSRDSCEIFHKNGFSARMSWISFQNFYGIMESIFSRFPTAKEPAADSQLTPIARTHGFSPAKMGPRCSRD